MKNFKLLFFVSFLITQISVCGQEFHIISYSTGETNEAAQKNVTSQMISLLDHAFVTDKYKYIDESHLSPIRAEKFMTRIVNEYSFRVDTSTICCIRVAEVNIDSYLANAKAEYPTFSGVIPESVIPIKIDDINKSNTSEILELFYSVFGSRANRVYDYELFVGNTIYSNDSIMDIPMYVVYKANKNTKAFGDDIIGVLNILSISKDEKDKINSQRHLEMQEIHLVDISSKHQYDYIEHRSEDCRYLYSPLDFNQLERIYLSMLLSYRIFDNNLNTFDIKQVDFFSPVAELVYGYKDDLVILGENSKYINGLSPAVYKLTDHCISYYSDNSILICSSFNHNEGEAVMSTNPIVVSIPKSDFLSITNFSIRRSNSACISIEKGGGYSWDNEEDAAKFLYRKYPFGILEDRLRTGKGMDKINATTRFSMFLVYEGESMFDATNLTLFELGDNKYQINYTLPDYYGMGKEFRGSQIVEVNDFEGDWKVDNIIHPVDYDIPVDYSKSLFYFNSLTQQKTNVTQQKSKWSRIWTLYKKGIDSDYKNVAPLLYGLSKFDALFGNKLKTMNFSEEAFFKEANRRVSIYCKYKDFFINWQDFSSFIDKDSVTIEKEIQLRKELWPYYGYFNSDKEFQDYYKQGESVFKNEVEKRSPQVKRQVYERDSVYFESFAEFEKSFTPAAAIGLDYPHYKITKIIQDNKASYDLTIQKKKRQAMTEFMKICSEGDIPKRIANRIFFLGPDFMSQQKESLKEKIWEKDKKYFKNRQEFDQIYSLGDKEYLNTTAARSNSDYEKYKDWFDFEYYLNFVLSGNDIESEKIYRQGIYNNSIEPYFKVNIFKDSQNIKSLLADKFNLVEGKDSFILLCNNGHDSVSKYVNKVYSSIKENVYADLSDQFDGRQDFDFYYDKGKTILEEELKARKLYTDYSNIFTDRQDFDKFYTQGPIIFESEVDARQFESRVNKYQNLDLKGGEESRKVKIVECINDVTSYKTKPASTYQRIIEILIHHNKYAKKEWNKHGAHFSSVILWYEAYVSNQYKNRLKEVKSNR